MPHLNSHSMVLESPECFEVILYNATRARSAQKEELGWYIEDERGGCSQVRCGEERAHRLV